MASRRTAFLRGLRLAQGIADRKRTMPMLASAGSSRRARSSRPSTRPSRAAIAGCEVRSSNVVCFP
jgi:hypothetical protein